MSLISLAICGVLAIASLVSLVAFLSANDSLFERPPEAPEPVPDPPVFPPLGADGDRDEEDAVIEPDWQDDLRAYHSHLCPCPACADVEARRQSRIKSMLRKNSQW